jgi:Na+/melibiose symporter-like transporter
MRELLRDGQFRLLFTGQVASMIGDSVMLIVLAIWMKDLTGSSGMAGAVILAIVAPALLSPLLGWGVDRMRRRPFLIWVNAASAVALVPLVAVRDRGDVWIIYLVAVLYGLSFLLNSAGLAGLLKHVVADDRLAEANAALRTVREGLRLVGPLAGAGLYAAAGAPAVVAVDGVSFLVAAGTLAMLALREQPPRRSDLHWLGEASAGFRHLFGEPLLRRTALAVASALLVFGTIESGVFAYVDTGLHRPATFVGVLVAVMGVGSIAGGLLTPRIIRRVGEPGTVALGLAALAFGLGPLVYPRVGLGLIAIPFAGAGVSLVVVAFATLMQRRTPQPLMGRVSTAADLLIGAPQTVSIAVGAILVAQVDYRWMFATATFGLVVVAGTLWTVRNTAAVSAATVVVEPVSVPLADR